MLYVHMLDITIPCSISLLFLLQLHANSLWKVVRVPETLSVGTTTTRATSADPSPMEDARAIRTTILRNTPATTIAASLACLKV